MKRLLSVFLALGLLAGCTGINFSQISHEAKDFHPNTIAVLPATVGEYESSRDVVDSIVSQRLAKTGWYNNVVDALTIKTQVNSSPELAENILKYIQQLNALGISEPTLTAKLRESLNSDALFLVYVTSWGYGRYEGNKIARVGLGVKLIDASKGTIIWKANHEIIEEYWVIKPTLDKMAEKLMALLLEEMPRGKVIKEDSMGIKEEGAVIKEEVVK